MSRSKAFLFLFVFLYGFDAFLAFVLCGDLFSGCKRTQGCVGKQQQRTKTRVCLDAASLRKFATSTAADMSHQCYQCNQCHRLCVEIYVQRDQYFASRVCVCFCPWKHRIKEKTPGSHFVLRSSVVELNFQKHQASLHTRRFDAVKNKMS